VRSSFSPSTSGLGPATSPCALRLRTLHSAPAHTQPPLPRQPRPRPWTGERRGLGGRGLGWVGGALRGGACSRDCADLCALLYCRRLRSPRVVVAEFKGLSYGCVAAHRPVEVAPLMLPVVILLLSLPREVSLASLYFQFPSPAGFSFLA
jgi:hypothetical protein